MDCHCGCVDAGASMQAAQAASTCCRVHGCRVVAVCRSQTVKQSNRLLKHAMTLKSILKSKIVLKERASAEAHKSQQLVNWKAQLDAVKRLACGLQLATLLFLSAHSRLKFKPRPTRRPCERALEWVPGWMNQQSQLKTISLTRRLRVWLHCALRSRRPTDQPLSSYPRLPEVEGWWA
jgi:hypothetical protein